jgi:ATP-binding cassette subfamily B (MDR/TAP) protein 1
MTKISEKMKLCTLRSKLSTNLAPKIGASYLRLLFATGATPLDYGLLAIGFFAAIGAGIPFPLLGILFGQLVDDLGSSTCTAKTSPAVTAQFSDSVREKVLYILYVTIANFTLIYLHTASWSLVGERLVRRLRNQYLSALLRQELAYFDTLPAGEVASRLDADLQTIQTGTSEKVGICITSLSYFVTAYIVAFVKSPRLAGMLFSIVPAYLLMALIGGNYVQKYASGMSDHIAKATAVASGGLANMVVVTAFGANNRLEKVFAQHLGEARKDGLKKAFVSSIQLGLLYFIAYSANALAFWEGSREIANTVANGGEGVSVGSVYTVIFILIDGKSISD